MQIWSGDTPECGPNETCVLHRGTKASTRFYRLFTSWHPVNYIPINFGYIPVNFGEQAITRSRGVCRRGTSSSSVPVRERDKERERVIKREEERERARERKRERKQRVRKREREREREIIKKEMERERARKRSRDGCGPVLKGGPREAPALPFPQCERFRPKVDRFVQHMYLTQCIS